MTEPDGAAFGGETPEADVVEQRIPVADRDADTWLDADRVTTARDWDANEADLIEQAMDVPTADDEFDFER